MSVADQRPLSPDTEATLLLCGRFDGRSDVGAVARPLTEAEYNRLARLLVAHDLRPGDLLSSVPEIVSAERERIDALLRRGMALALALDRWSRIGIGVLGRGDAGYPAKLRSRLRGSAPPLLYVAGAAAALDDEALCIIGSRDATEAGLRFSRMVGSTCAEAGVAVVSGGARGVDREAMTAALDAGGRSIGVLADSLAKAVLARTQREAILDGRLVLASPFDPDARFMVGNAMGRNKHLYALADAAVVVDAETEGGTWSGAVENAKHHWTPAYVRLGDEMRKGNQRLVEMGLLPLPEQEAQGSGWLRRLLDAAPSVAAQASASADARVPLGPDGDAEAAFAAFVARVLVLVDNAPLSQREIAGQLGIKQSQARDWLASAVERGLLRKGTKGRPAAYGRPQPDLLLRQTA